MSVNWGKDHTSTAQIPIFDLYDGYGQSLYEDVCLYNWSGLNGLLMYSYWCANKLRFVAPTMWLCDALIKKVNYAKLEQVADIQQRIGIHKLQLKPQVTLDDLEFALLPILPIEKEKQESG